MSASSMKVVEGDDEDDAVKTPIKLNMCKRGVVFLIACMTEIVAWSWLLVTGITFIMTAHNVEMVMRSTVSIVFVMQVDELLYGVCCSKKLKEDMEKTTYKIWSKVGQATFLCLVSFACVSLADLFLRTCPFLECRSLHCYNQVPGVKDQRGSDKMVDRFFFYCHLPFLIITSHVIVYGEILSVVCSRIVLIWVLLQISVLHFTVSVSSTPQILLLLTPTLEEPVDVLAFLLVGSFHAQVFGAWKASAGQRGARSHSGTSN